MTIATAEKKIEALTLKVDALDAYIRKRLGEPVVLPADKPLFVTNWVTSPSDSGWVVQEFKPGRATLVPTREGRMGVRLHTEPGDINVAGSGVHERNDLSLSQQQTDGFEGREAWWGHSLLFPDDWVPGTSWYVVADFHHSSNSGGQANMNLDACRWDGGKLGIRLYAGQKDTLTVQSEIGTIARNVWYDCVYHVRWTAGAGGYFDAWVNGKRHLSYKGPTLYPNDGVYLKLANYHEASGKPSSVIHDRVIRGKTWQSVSLTPLEGVTA